MKKIFILAGILACVSNLFANENDSIKTFNLEQVNVYCQKETNLKNAPVSATLLTAQKINQAQITSIKDMNGKAANFFIPDYGSAMSNAVYVRGIGSRNSGQSIALYVDNVPYLDKTAFDFELFDVAQMEILRGAQGTLYGRNAMSGIVNIYTLSPLSFQGTRAAITAGNYGYVQARASHYAKLNNKLGVSIGGFYGQHNGFYTNDFTGKKMDDEKSAGARAKLIWNVQPNFRIEYVSDFDYIKQGAFPYGLYNAQTSTTAKPNINDASDYNRKTLNNSIFSQFINDDLMLTASLSHQYFNDQMNMDQDFTAASVFTVQQNQKQNMINGEVIIKSLPGNSRYQWLIGATAFGQKLDMHVPVKFKKDAIVTMIQPGFEKAGMTVTSPSFDIPGWYDNTRSGAALFHQSTMSHLFTEGLSLTFGMRLDYESVKMDYNANAALNVTMNRGGKVIPMTLKSELTGSVDTAFVELLPKVALKYEWNNHNVVYGSISRGYKTGGFNVQMMSDIMQTKFMSASKPNAPEPDVKRKTLYQPEFSWNYELGIRNSFWNSRLKTQLTLFYMDITGLQITRFVNSGAGRMLTNAGKSVSKGVEIAAETDLGYGFSVSLNYGYAHAKFTQYDMGTKKIKDVEIKLDYSGKYVPYAPQHTVGAALNYFKSFQNGFINEFYGTVSYSGAGKIYWQESNVLSENFYNLVDAKIGAKKGAFGLELWGKNLLNTTYNAFYFESFGNAFFQKGKPLQFGARLTLDI